MLNWRHERYCWIPFANAGTFENRHFDVTAFVTYLAKFADPRTGAIQLNDADVFRALACLCGAHMDERAAFCALVKRVVATPCVTVIGTVLTIPEYLGWQRSKDPRKRLYVREVDTFSNLPAFARIYAAELIRTASHDGIVHVGSPETFAYKIARTRTNEPRADARKSFEERFLTRVQALVTEGFLSADAKLRVRNYKAAQAHDPAPLSADAKRARAEPSAWSRHEPKTEGYRRPRREGDGDPDERVTVTPTATPTVTPPTTASVSSGNYSLSIAAKPPVPTVPTVPFSTKSEDARDVGETGVHASGVHAPAGGGSSGSGIETTSDRIGASHGASERQGEPMQREFSFEPKSETEPVPPKGRNATPKPAPTPLSFTVAEAFGFLAERAKGRFVPGEPAAWQRSTCVPVQKHIRAFPDPDDWRLVGEWLGAGGRAWMGPLSFKWVRGDDFLEAIGLAKAWRDEGRKALVKGPFAPPMKASESNALPVSKGAWDNVPEGAPVSRSLFGK